MLHLGLFGTDVVAILPPTDPLEAVARSGALDVAERNSRTTIVLSQAEVKTSLPTRVVVPASVGRKPIDRS